MANLTKISDIMPEGFFSIELEDTIHKADEIMRNENIKHIPVVDNGKFIGLITERTIMEYTLRKLYDFDDDFGSQGYDRVIDFQNIMIKNLHLIYPEDSVRKAVEIMAKKRIDCLPVVDWEKNLLGLLTFTDILLFLNKKFSELDNF
jgi:CBS domain-containing membrane protein